MTPAPQPPPITGAGVELFVQLFPLVLLLYAVSVVLSAEVQTVRETSSFHQWRREAHTAFALVLASLMYGLWTLAAPGWLSIGEPVLTYLVDHIRGGRPVLLNVSGALIFAVVFRWASSLRNPNRGFWPPTWWCLPRQPSSAAPAERDR